MENTKFVSIKEAAKIAKVSTRTVSYWIEKDLLRKVPQISVYGSSATHIYKDDLEEAIKMKKNRATRGKARRRKPVKPVSDHRIDELMHMAENIIIYQKRNYRLVRSLSIFSWVTLSCLLAINIITTIIKPLINILSNYLG